MDGTVHQEKIRRLKDRILQHLKTMPPFAPRLNIGNLGVATLHFFCARRCTHAFPMLNGGVVKGAHLKVLRDFVLQLSAGFRHTQAQTQTQTQPKNVHVSFDLGQEPSTCEMCGRILGRMSTNK